MDKPECVRERLNDDGKPKIPFDNLHLNISEIDAYDKDLNFIFSEREPGKTTTIIANKAYKAFKEKKQFFISLVFNTVDINDVAIYSIQKTVNKFQNREVQLTYNKSDAEKGAVLVFDKIENRPFFAMFSLSVPMKRIKSLNLGTPSLILLDEASVATQLCEKYTVCKAMKVKEIYKTFAREAPNHKLKFYAMANPYSKYNPLLIDWGIPMDKIKKGSVYTDEKHLVMCATLKPELREKILETDPFYQFDDTYSKYAFDGEFIQDEDIPIETKQPNGYFLRYVFRIQNRYLYVWRKTADLERDPFDNVKFWIEATGDKPGKKQNVYCADFTQLLKNAVLVKSYKGFFELIKISVARNCVSYNTPEAFYLMTQLYNSF